MPLEEYRGMRNFRVSQEPKGRNRRSAREQIFVVQEHDASLPDHQSDDWRSHSPRVSYLIDLLHDWI